MSDWQIAVLAGVLTYIALGMLFAILFRYMVGRFSPTQLKKFSFWFFMKVWVLWLYYCFTSITTFGTAISMGRNIAKNRMSSFNRREETEEEKKDNQDNQEDNQEDNQDDSKNI